MLFREVYVLDLRTWVWAPIASQSVGPSPRSVPPQLHSLCNEQKDTETTCRVGIAALLIRVPAGTCA